ncbi:helix-turn-helix domain-containing protein [Streptomyces sp. NPDC055089]
MLDAMGDYTPADIGLSGVLWTRASVKALIKLVCGVAMTEQGVGKWLWRHGFTPQRPARHSYRQQPGKVRAWLDQEYPEIAARARFPMITNPRACTATHPYLDRTPMCARAEPPSERTRGLTAARSRCPLRPLTAPRPPDSSVSGITTGSLSPGGTEQLDRDLVSNW